MKILSFISVFALLSTAHATAWHATFVCEHGAVVFDRNLVPEELTNQLVIHGGDFLERIRTTTGFPATCNNGIQPGCTQFYFDQGPTAVIALRKSDVNPQVLSSVPDVGQVRLEEAKGTITLFWKFSGWGEGSGALQQKDWIFRNCQEVM